MPTIRYQIRSEYGLADPELHAAADRDDPEAILEGVAMAGLVGVLRQLGDLAEFAAEIFHELHEEVMSTAARGHGLMLRVQQLEAEFPSVEKAFFSQSVHSSFAYNDGSDWHANIQMDQNLVTRGDMPRFILDSYEECRGPPRLFMLDKFDIAGAGACLKRYSDPSFFKMDLTSSGMAGVDVPREKKPRKTKKKGGSRWKIGQTLESLLSPPTDSSLQSKALGQVKGKPITRFVRLKSRHLRHVDRSLMEHLLELHSDVQKVVLESSRSHMNRKILPIDFTDPVSEIHDLVIDKSADESFLGEKNSISSPISGETRSQRYETEYQNMKDELPELQDQHACEVRETGKGFHLIKPEEILADPKAMTGDHVDEYKLSILEKTEAFGMMDQKLVDTEVKLEGNGDGYRSEDISSEQENFMDALNSIESEVETGSGSKIKPDAGVEALDADSSEGVDELQGQISEPYYTENSTIPFDSQNVVQNEISSLPNSDTSSTMLEIEATQEVSIMHNLHVNTESYLGENDDKISEEVWSTLEVTDSVDMNSSEPCSTKMFNDPVLRSELGSPHISDSFLEEPEHAEHVEELMSEDAAEGTEMSSYLSPTIPLSQDVMPPPTGSTIGEKQESVYQVTEVCIGEESILSNYSNTSILPIQHDGIAAYMQNGLQPKELLDISFHDVEVTDNGLSCGNENEHVTENLHTECHPLEVIPEDMVVRSDSYDEVSEVKDENTVGQIFVGDDEDSPLPLIMQIEESQESSNQDVNSCLIGEMSPEIPPTTLDTIDFVAHHEGIKEDAEKAFADEDLLYCKSADGLEKKYEIEKSIIEESQEFDLDKNFSLVGELEIPAVTLDTSNIPVSHDSLVEERGNVIDRDGFIYCKSAVDLEDMDELTNSKHEMPDNVPSKHVDFFGAEEIEKFDNMESAELLQSHSETSIFSDDEQLHPHSYDSELIDYAVPLTEHLNCADDSTGYSLEDKEEIEQNMYTDKISSRNVVVQDNPAAHDTSSFYSPEVSYLQGQLEEDPVPTAVTSYHHDLNSHENGSPKKTASVDIRSILDMTHSSDEQPLSDHAVPNSGLLGEESSNIKDAGVSDDLYNTHNEFEYIIDHTLPQCSAERKEGTSPKCLEQDPCENVNEELSLPTNVLSDPATPPEVMDFILQDNSAENVTSSTEVDEHLELNRSVGINAQSPGEELDTNYSNSKLNESHVSLSSRDMPGQLEYEAFASSGNGSEHSISSLASNVLATPLPQFGNLSFATNKSASQLSHEKSEDESASFFSLQDFGESPPLPPLPPLQWRTGNFRENPLLSDANSSEHLTGTTLSLTPSELETKPESGFLVAGSEMDQLVNPFTNTPTQQSKSFQPDVLKGEKVHPLKLSELPPILDHERHQYDNLFPERKLMDLSPESSVTSSLEYEKIQSGSDSFVDLKLHSANPFVPEDETYDHPAPLKDEMILAERTSQSEELPGLELERIDDSLHGNPNMDKEMIQPENPFLARLASNNKKYHGVSGDDEVHLKLSEPSLTSVLEIPHPGYLAVMEEDHLIQYGALWTADDRRANIRPLSVRNRPRNPLIEAVAAHDRNTLRKVSELVHPSDNPKTDERNSLLEQIRNKAFSLKPAALSKQNVKGPPRNLKVAAILEKANAIRQACAGSDEDDDGDSWSDS